MYQDAADHNAVFTGSLNERWALKLHGKINGGLALVGNTIYADTFAPEAVAIDVQTGKLRWARPAGNVLMTTPIVDTQRVIFGSGTNDMLPNEHPAQLGDAKTGDRVFANDVRTGAERWAFRTVGEDMPSPVDAGDKVIFANGDSHIYALNERTGTLVWSAPLPGVDSMSSAAFDRGAVFVSVSAVEHVQADEEVGYTLAFDVNSGREIWRAQHGNGDCSPTIGNGLVFVESVGYDYYGPNKLLGWMGTNYVYAMDERTGAVRWKYKSRVGYFNAVASLERAIAGVYDRGTLYQSVPATNEFVAFDAPSGTVKWRFRTSGPVKMSAIVVDRHVVFGDGAGLLYVLNAQNGAVEAIRPFPKPFGPSPPILAGRTLIAANGDTVQAIRFASLLER